MQIELQDDEAALVIRSNGTPEVMIPQLKQDTNEEMSASSAVVFMLAIKLCDEKFVDDLFDKLEDLMSVQSALEQINPTKEQ